MSAAPTSTAAAAPMVPRLARSAARLVRLTPLLAFTAAAADNGGLQRLRDLHLAGSYDSAKSLDQFAKALGPIAPGLTLLSLHGGGHLSGQVVEELTGLLKQLEIFESEECGPEAEQLTIAAAHLRKLVMSPARRSRGWMSLLHPI